MSIPVIETRRTSTTRKEGARHPVITGSILLANVVVGALHLLALPIIIAADKTFAARVERKPQREAKKAGRRIAYRQSMGLHDPMFRQ
jgi:hypothetical protein